VEAYHVENFGCRANRSDGEAIASGLRSRGLYEAAGADSAQLVVLNTCSVTAEADRSARAFLRRIRRINPMAKVVVTGCYAQRAPEEIASLKLADAIVGNSHKGSVVDIAADLATGLSVDSDTNGANPHDLIPISALTDPSNRVIVDESFAHFELATLPFAADAHQTRPNLKVQDGCGNRCSFCVIPITRGPSRSIPQQTCLDCVRAFVERGGQELVLSGINLGRWGRDFVVKESFADLVSAILRETTLPRLRLSSIEPMDWTHALLALLREYGTGRHPRLAPHAHLPLQSGADAILRKMHRRYRPWHYAERVAAIRASMPDAAIGADVMVGFPGETDQLFKETYRFIDALPFTYLHLFPFSARPGTPGWDLDRSNPVSSTAVDERMAALRALAGEKARSFRHQFIGRTLSVVTLEGKTVRTPTLSANFLKVELVEKLPANRMIEARILSGAPGEQLLGTVIEMGI
jgi:threonylcarbamoyladenosine tRNA methylthiotransferase MtaB